MGNGSNHRVIRPWGQAVRERIERDMAKEPEGFVVALDFTKIWLIDYSRVEEIVMKPVCQYNGKL